MRIAGGEGKGKRLRYPAKGLRPTRDMVKQAIFNILRSRVTGAKVCDLFAGAGSLGIEALARGADCVLFVEQDRRTVRFLKANLGSNRNRAEVVIGDVMRVLPKLAGAKFDIVLADPPYEHGLDRATLEMVARYNLLRSDGILILEHSRRDKPGCPAGLRPIKEHIFGDTVVSVFAAITHDA